MHRRRLKLSWNFQNVDAKIAIISHGVINFKGNSLRVKKWVLPKENGQLSEWTHKNPSSSLILDFDTSEFIHVVLRTCFILAMHKIKTIAHHAHKDSQEVNVVGSGHHQSTEKVVSPMSHVNFTTKPLDIGNGHHSTIIFFFMIKLNKNII